jgi:hypothetical protein
MKSPKQLPADLRDWIKARTFEIGAEMALRPDSPQVWQGRLGRESELRRWIHVIDRPGAYTNWPYRERPPAR